MNEARRTESQLDYMRQLVAAGWGGVASARQEHKGPFLSASLKYSAWTPAAIGAAVGLIAGRAIERNKRSALAIGGAVGTLVGFGAAMGWASRHFMKSAAQTAVRRVNEARDAHWLELNPIDYA